MFKEQNLTHLNRLHRALIHANVRPRASFHMGDYILTLWYKKPLLLTRCFLLWVSVFKDVFGPEKNAALSWGCWFWWWSSLPCHCQGMLVMDYLAASTGCVGFFFFVFLQQWEGADQVWGAAQVVVAMTGEWAVKPRGDRFMGHLVLSEVKGQGYMTCPSLYYSAICGEPWTVQSVTSNYRTLQTQDDFQDDVTLMQVYHWRD